VILLSAEDETDDTITPRLIAAGADLKRVTILHMLREAAGKKRMFSLVSDLPALRHKVLAVGGVKLLAIDPISAYLGIGKIDSSRAGDVRAVLGPLKEMSEELELATLGVMHFNKKIDVTTVLLRISDSLAFGAAPRPVYGIVNDEENRRRLFVKGKNNLAPYDQNSLAFGFETRHVGVDMRTREPVYAPCIVWHPEPVDVTATEAMQAAAENKSPSSRDNAKRFVETLLDNGPIGSKTVYEAAEENGISKGTLRRAQKELKIEVKQDGPPDEKGHSTWQWHLPT